MDEVELSDRAIFIHAGRKMAEGTPNQLAKMFVGKVYRVDVQPTSELVGKLNEIEKISSRRFGASIHLHIPEGHSIEDFRDDLHQLGIGMDLITPLSPELEDTFIQLMGK
jgi:ABC-type multidrug transport system ATPase subunit